jgi:diketogulonate reductase-like aldo/keto reductase
MRGARSFSIFTVWIQRPKKANGVRSKGVMMNKILVLLLGWILTLVSCQKDDGIPRVTLENGYELPLIGLGVGNLQHELIPSQIKSGIGMDTLLIDTAQASQNERLILAGIDAGLPSSKIRSKQADSKVVDVITKVWYTHLGYERTILAVLDSLEGLNHPNVRLHILLHWPRCFEEIEWMECEKEEENLPVRIKKAGPPPHLDPKAFVESWRALEDLFLGNTEYTKKYAKHGEGMEIPVIATIGVSNFDIHDLEEIHKTARVKPHILQGNVASFVFDEALIDYLDEHDIHFQAYNVMNGIIGPWAADRAPNSLQALEQVAEELSDASVDTYTPAQVVLKWLVDENVSVIPRTTQAEHLVANSGKSIAAMPSLSDSQRDQVWDAVRGLLEGKDPEPEF